MKECKKKMYQIVEELSEVLKDSVKNDRGTEPWLEIDKTGKTKTTNVYFFMKNGNYVEIACYDWSEKLKAIDHFRISIITDQVNEMYNKIYNN